MADLASQLILHPSVSQALQYGTSTTGRDKAYRAAQYFARFYAWYLLKKGTKDEAQRWAALMTHLGTARKLLRLGKPIEHLQAALRSALAPGPLAEQLTTIAKQASYFAFLTFDSVVWANAIKFIKLKQETVQRVRKTSFQFWFAGILFSIMNGIFKTTRLVREAKRLEASRAWGDKDLAEEAARETRLNNLKASRATTRRQLLVDWLDIWIPATGAGLVNVNEGTLGIFGLVTSLVGVKAQWDALSRK
ncbi:hypothetical protein APHAL10511_006281 [Amanita phalloides]|nr:hypothetical protein APHAL10511_006281 [Amanita phalloides]